MATETRAKTVRRSKTSSGEGVQWDAVTEAALLMRDIMEAEGLSPWPKLTGGKGIHLMAPLPEGITHDAAHQQARDLVRCGLAAWTGGDVNALN